MEEAQARIAEKIEFGMTTSNEVAESTHERRARNIANDILSELQAAYWRAFARWTLRLDVRVGGGQDLFELVFEEWAELPTPD